MAIWASFLEVKRPRHEADCPLPSSGEVKNELRCYHHLSICLHGMHVDPISVRTASQIINFICVCRRKLHWEWWSSVMWCCVAGLVIPDISKEYESSDIV